MLSRSALRKRISTHLASELSGWTESAYPYGDLGVESETRQHLAFAVGLGQSTPYGNGRQKVATGALMVTEVKIEFLHQVRGNLIDLVPDHDDAETALGLLLAAAKSVDPTDFSSRPYISLVEEPVSFPDFVRHRVRLTVPHRIALNSE